MKIYLAAAFQCRERMREYAGILTQLGHEVVSSWVTDDNADQAEFWQSDAKRCVADVQNCDVVLNFTGETGRGGRHVEFGIALALDKKQVVIGQREHIFHYLPGIAQHDNFAQYCNRTPAIKPFVSRYEHNKDEKAFCVNCGIGTKAVWVIDTFPVCAQCAEDIRTEDETHGVVIIEE